MTQKVVAQVFFFTGSSFLGGYTKFDRFFQFDEFVEMMSETKCPERIQKAVFLIGKLCRVFELSRVARWYSFK
jgi:hypothetical protein